ncbi:MAG: hypothetical protein E4H40_07645 [Candidatus Brocadiia bacterium]|nr:MAG: hypothetical protein E4H40_07645 [Candidatus Brocadiia bacterium]
MYVGIAVHWIARIDRTYDVISVVEYGGLECEFSVWAAGSCAPAGSDNFCFCGKGVCGKTSFSVYLCLIAVIVWVMDRFRMEIFSYYFCEVICIDGLFDAEALTIFPNPVVF